MDAAVQDAIRRAPIDVAQLSAIEARLTASITSAVKLAVDAAVANLKAYLADHLDQLVADRFDDSLNLLLKDEVANVVDPYRSDIQEVHDNNLTVFDAHCSAAMDSFTTDAFTRCDRKLAQMKSSTDSFTYLVDRSKEQALSAVALAKDNALAAIARAASAAPLTVDATAPTLSDTDLARMCAQQTDETDPAATARVSWRNAPRADNPPTAAPSPSSQHGGAPPHPQRYPSEVPRRSLHYGGAPPMTTSFGGTPHGGVPTPSPRSLTSRDIGATADPDYHCGKHGIDPEFELTEDCLLRIGFTSPEYFGEIMRAHRTIVNSWSSKNNGTYGPQKDAILKSTTFTSKMVLDGFDAPSIVHWYERLTATCEAFRIGLVPFDAIQFRRRHEGLCLPGLGLDRYVDMASALCTVMSVCLENGDSRVKAMVASVETKSRNGYEIIYRLFCRYVPGFDPARTVDRPSWDDYEGDVMKYADAYDLYFRLSAKSGGYHTAFHRSVLFLKGITSPALMKVVEPLLIAVESHKPDENAFEGEWIGMLPFHLQVDELAQKIVERSKVEPFDRDLARRGHRINRFAADYGTESSPLSDDDDTPESIEGHMQGYVVPTIAQARRPNGLPGRRMPNTSYTRKPDPLRRLRPDGPRLTCQACGKAGHVANTCDFLAMSVFLQRYLKNGIGTKASIEDAEKRWLDRWKERGGNPVSTPSKVYQVYAEHSGLDLDQMEDEIDWLCWPVDTRDE